MRSLTLKTVALCQVLAIGGVVAAEAIDGRWAPSAFACSGEAFTRPETPLIVAAATVRWFDTDCRVVSNYKVNQTWYLQGSCRSEGRTTTIPIMLELQADRLRVGWNKEPIQEMRRCTGRQF